MHTARLAEAAYRAYGSVTDFKNYQGRPMPDWCDLGDTIQRAWQAAVAEVVVSLSVNVHVHCGGGESGQAEVLARLDEIRSIVESTVDQINAQTARVQAIDANLEALQRDFRAYLATQEARVTQPTAEEQAALDNLSNSVGAVVNREDEFAVEMPDQAPPMEPTP